MHMCVHVHVRVCGVAMDRAGVERDTGTDSQDETTETGSVRNF